MNFKKIIVCCSLLLVIISCKKDISESASAMRQITSGNPPALQALKPIPESRKTLLVVDYESDMDAFVQTIYRVNGLDAVPYKKSLFTGEKNVYIKDICPGSGINNAYFLYQSFKGVFKDEGIWNITMDGLKKTKIVDGFSVGGAFELDFDRVNNTIYWGEGVNADQMKIWKCNTDGSGKVQLKINGIPEVGRFAVDGEGKRIFFKYLINGKAVIGSCDLSGNIIAPIVAAMPTIDDTFSPIDLDFNSQTLFTTNNAKTVILSAKMNVVNQDATVLTKNFTFRYKGLTYDFLKPNLYFSLTTDNNHEAKELFSSDFQGKNVKKILVGFSDIDLVTGIFTF